MAKEVWQKFWTDFDIEMQTDRRRLEIERGTIRWKLMQNFIKGILGEYGSLKSIEIGSGIGDNSLLLSWEGVEATLADYSEEALAKAQTRFAAHRQKASFILADMLDVKPDMEERYDLSMSFGLAEHFEGDERFRIIESHAKVLREGGLTFISVPYRYAVLYRAWMARCIRRGTWPYGLEIPYSKTELRSHAEKAGFHTLGFIQSSFWAECHWHFPKLHLERILNGVLERKSLLNIFGYALVYVGQKHNDQLRIKRARL